MAGPLSSQEIANAAYGKPSDQSLENYFAQDELPVQEEEPEERLNDNRKRDVRAVKRGSEQEEGGRAESKRMKAAQQGMPSGDSTLNPKTLNARSDPPPSRITRLVFYLAGRNHHSDHPNLPQNN
jgi:hypothetical protein